MPRTDNNPAGTGTGLPAIHNPRPLIVALTPEDFDQIRAYVAMRAACTPKDSRIRGDAPSVGTVGEYAYMKHFGFQDIRVCEHPGYDFRYPDGLLIDVHTVTTHRTELYAPLDSLRASHAHVLAEYIPGHKTVSLLGSVGTDALVREGRPADDGKPGLRLSRFKLDEFPPVVLTRYRRKPHWNGRFDPE